MKNAFKTLAVALTLVSCGGTEVTSADLVGSWKADPSSLELTLGDGIPTEFKAMIEAGKEERMNEFANEAEGMLIKFTKDTTVLRKEENSNEVKQIEKWGEIILSKHGLDDVNVNYKVVGEKLYISGELAGVWLKLNVTLSEISADKFTVNLTAEDLIAQVKEQEPEAMNMVPDEFDIDAMAKGTSMSMSFNR